MATIENLEGKTFGRLKVLERASNDSYNHTIWLCICDCGNYRKVRATSLKKGITKNCVECSIRTPCKHNLTGTRIYHSWEKMKSRVYNKNNARYKNYGARGIVVCDNWKNSFIEFYNWAMENGYTDELTLDRIDPNGNYEPSNCRWATQKEQQNNRTNNIKVKYKGENKTVAEWCEILNIKRHQFEKHIKENE